MKPAPVFEKKFKKASDALQAALGLFRNPKRWTQGHLAISDGYACSTKSKNAEAFCALGAVKRVNGPAEKSATAFLREAAKQILIDSKMYPVVAITEKPKNEHIFTLNDYVEDSPNSNKTLNKVRKMFRLAIKNAKLAEN